MLLAGKRGHGKTRYALQLLTGAVSRGKRSWMFSLDNDMPEPLLQGTFLPKLPAPALQQLRIDASEAICADYVIQQTALQIQEGSVIVVNYLQALDQRRTTPTLQTQV